MYRAIERAKEDGVTLTQEVTQQGNKVSQQVTQAGFEYLKRIYLDLAGSGDDGSSEQFDLVASLFEQLQEKDRQIAEKDRQLEQKDLQISQLIEQSRNFQVLLKSEQDRSLPVPEERPRLLSRLFGRKP